MNNYNWGKALDELKVLEGIKSDSALAKTLGISRAFISAIRNERKNIPRKTRKDILVRLGHDMSIEDQLECQILAKASVYSRAPQLVMKQVALARANGKCELCKMPAPFLLPNGKPFLEAHHIKSLSEGGGNSIDNIAMLCPNCHRKMEYINDKSDLDELIRVCESVNRH